MAGAEAGVAVARDARRGPRASAAVAAALGRAAPPAVAGDGAPAALAALAAAEPSEVRRRPA